LGLKEKHPLDMARHSEEYSFMAQAQLDPMFDLDVSFSCNDGHSWTPRLHSSVCP
jgi:hypothetical protein